jgi:endonuclease-3
VRTTPAKKAARTTPAKKAARATPAKKATRKAPAKGAARVALPVAAPQLDDAAVRAAAARGASTYQRLRELHPDAHCELNHRSPFELLVATVLSAQTTDVLVNKVTPHLFARYPDAPALAAAQPAEVGPLLQRQGMGMYNQKAKNIVGLARGLVTKHGGEVPRTLAELVALPGVGRKTANVVLGVAFGVPEGVVVDTHVQRIAQRLGWTRSAKPEQIERDLCALFPRSEWDMISHTLIFHGRRICFARKPACGGCGVNDACPSAFHAEEIGRKPRRPRPR